MEKMLVKYVTLVVCTALLYGCEISGSLGPVDEGVANDALCKYSWQMSYTDFDDAYISWRFIFYTNGEGEEIISRSLFGQTTSQEYWFDWYWSSDSYTSLCLEYGANDVSYMDQIFIMDNELTCVMNDATLVFYGW